MTHQLATTIILTFLTLLSGGASVLALVGLLASVPHPRWRKALSVALPMICGLTAALFIERALLVHHTWQPLESHVDGLILINVLVTLTLCFLQTRQRMENLSAFVLPVVTLLMAWAICASQWTFQGFAIGSIWQTVHRLGVYLGSVFYLVAAGSGVMFLYVRRQLKHKKARDDQQRLPSLEAIETLMVNTATLGFALISLGLVSGIIINFSHQGFAGNRWYVWKIILAILTWLVYGVVMNVRYTKTFRGTRAAWLSLIGLLLVLLTFIASLLMLEQSRKADASTTPPTMMADRQSSSPWSVVGCDGHLSDFSSALASKEVASCVL